MNLYPLLRFLLFRLDPETAHRATLQALHTVHRWHLTRLLATPHVSCPRRVMGLEFPNPVGLAAGLDKNGEYIEALAALGFGFIEVGTVTPRPQPGNPRPRLFRLPQASALINRMGFNNKGVDYLVERVKRSRYTGILGINIGKNADTPMESAVGDYLTGLRRVYPHAGYVAVNISSPNTPQLRRLQGEVELRRLLEALKTEQSALAAAHGRYIPLVVKIAPDLTAPEIERIGSLLLEYRVDGVIATNTSIGREGVRGLRFGGESGGLSGAPLTAKATRVVAELAQVFGGQLPIIAAGGIMSARDAGEKFRAGAALIQLYTGLIYSGPALIKSIVGTSGNSVAAENR